MPMMPPNAMMQGPPATPPATPTLSAYPQSSAAPGPGGGGASPAGRMEALPRLVFQVDQVLDVLARAVPGASEEIDQAKAIIRGVLAKALQGGPGGTPPPGPASPPPMMGGRGGPGGPVA